MTRGASVGPVLLGLTVRPETVWIREKTALIGLRISVDASAPPRSSAHVRRMADFTVAALSGRRMGMPATLARARRWDPQP